MDKDKIRVLMFDCYRELYKQATPSADFDELIKETNGDIPFMDYSISQDDYENIVSNILKKSRLSKHYKQMVRNSVALGYSPTFKLNK